MLSFLEIVHSGVRGVVRQAGKPVGASITVDGIAHTMYADPAMGDFYRPLTEGTCTLVSALSFVYCMQTCYARAWATWRRPAQYMYLACSPSSTRRSPLALIDLLMRNLYIMIHYYTTVKAFLQCTELGACVMKCLGCKLMPKLQD
jgi:hypothetical protein